MRMAAPVLTAAEQVKVLSGKKNKKRVVKNVLGLPFNLKVASPLVVPKETEKLNKILHRLLPLAKLPIQQNLKFKKPKDWKEAAPEESHAKELAKNKRSQLCLGVNEVNKSIKKELISAVLLASDIQPKLFIRHLNLLCTQNKIPFLHVPELREVTKNSVGFPCIAVGFKKNFSDFLEAVEEIKLIAKSQNNISTSEDQEISIKSSELDNEVSDSEEFQEVNEIKSGKTFTYLYRTLTKSRVFVPENKECDMLPQKSELDFISVLEGDDSKIKTKINFELRTTKNSLRKQKNKKMLNMTDLNMFQIDEGEEDLQVPKKKTKIGWEIDKKGTKKNFKYEPPNLCRIPMNLERNRKIKK